MTALFTPVPTSHQMHLRKVQRNLHEKMRDELRIETSAVSKEDRRKEQFVAGQHS